MKRILLSIAMLAVTVTMMAQANVYFTKDISSQAMPQSYNIFRIDGTPVGTNMKSLDALSEGLYIINGKKVAIK